MHLNHFSRNIRQSRFKNLHPSLNFKHSISVRICLVTKLIKSLTELGNNFSHSVDISVNLFFHNFVFVQRTIKLHFHHYPFLRQLCCSSSRLWQNLLRHLAGLGRHLQLLGKGRSELIQLPPRHFKTCSPLEELTLLYKPFNSHIL